MTKNIIEAYIEQKHQFIIVLSGLPTTYVDKFAKILADDFKFSIILMQDYLIDNSKSIMSIDNYDINKMDKDVHNNKRKGVIISTLVLPKNIIKHNIDYHINLSISKSKSLERDPNLNKDLIAFYNNQLKNSFVNRFLNINELNDDDISNKLFEMNIDYVLNKLDDGTYSEKTISVSSPVHKTKFKSYSDNDEDIYKKIDKDSIDIYEDLTDEDIFKKLDDDSIDIYENITEDITSDDIYFDDTMIPTKHIESDKNFIESISDSSSFNNSNLNNSESTNEEQDSVELSVKKISNKEQDNTELSSEESASAKLSPIESTNEESTLSNNQDIYKKIDEDTVDIYDNITENKTTEDSSSNTLSDKSDDNEIVIGGFRNLFNKYDTFKNKDIVTGFRKLKKSI